MSRILKRPMFRTGGTPNEGIMHGLVDRKGFYQGSIDPERTRSDVQTELDILSEYAPLPKSRFPLGSIGLNLVSGEYAGDGLLANIARSMKGPYEGWTAADDARAQALAQRRAGAAGRSIAQQRTEALARQKAMTSGKQFRDIEVAEELGKIIPQIYVLEEKLKKDPDNADLKIKLDVLRTKRRNFSKNNPVTEAALDIFAKSTTGQLLFNNLKEDLLKQDRIDGTNKYTGENDRALIADAIKELKNQLSEFSRSSNADGGRVGYYAGTPNTGAMPMEPVQASVTETIDTSVEENPISYDQLRSRLPQEITNDIVRLLSVSAEALEDFANISSQKDVDNFNKKYSVNLVLPSEA